MMNKTDVFGNNINFSNDIISKMTVKGLLGKWTSRIYSDVCYALFAYHMKTGNPDAGAFLYVQSLFRDLHTKITHITPVLEDMVRRDLHGIEDIFIAVFGVMSPEVYVLRTFLRLVSCMGAWDSDSMWTDCMGDERLRLILSGSRKE